MSRRIALFVVMGLSICGVMRGGWAESVGVSAPTWLRAPHISGSQRKLTALDREVPWLIDAYQVNGIELTELAGRRHRIEDQGRLTWAWVQAIDQQRTDRAAELRLPKGVNAFDASVHGP